MLIGIHPDKKGEGNFSDKWIDFLQKKEIQYIILDLTQQDALEHAKQCDGIMWRWAHNPQDKQCAQKVLFTIEHVLKIPIFPDISTSWHYDEKTAQFYLLRAISAPVPNTWLFWQQDAAVAWAQSATYPLIFKLSSGAGSSNVIKVANFKQAGILIRKMFERGFFPYTVNEFENSLIPKNLVGCKALLSRFYYAPRYVLCGDYPPLNPVFWKPEYGYVYFQEFLPENTFDTRVTIIGDRAFAFRRMNRPGDFRASGSGNINYDQEMIDKRCIEIAFRISEECKFQSMAYDFLVKENKPVVCEISYTFSDQAVYDCPGHWDYRMHWHEGHMWPEEAQAEDLIKKLSERRTII
jgi:glutathione synthase/RimK-type ligase-like ATP-grasp enzyme